MLLDFFNGFLYQHIARVAKGLYAAKRVYRYGFTPFRIAGGLLFSESLLPRCFQLPLDASFLKLLRSGHECFVSMGG
ncbi:uncharacterized protein Dmul_32420 [Desulfococcus multivorans]|nr:uncharacterized protein Dmul_32420 [Desulfococcus multivorans]